MPFSGKYIRRILSSIILLGIVFLVLRDRESPKTLSPTNSPEDQTITQTSNLTALPHPEATEHDAKQNASEELKPGSSAWAQMLKKYYAWGISHGYGQFLNLNSEYKTYDEHTLKVLADSGDLEALGILGDRALKNNDVKLARQYNEQAAIRGSTLALVILNPGGPLWSSVSVEEERTYYANEAERTKDYYETLAYGKVAALRGDLRQNNIRNGYKVKSRKLVITDEDETAINQRAQEIYNDLESKRLALGLGKFDNTPIP